MENTKQYYISIIIPVCNNPVLFQKTISTVLNQTKNNTELIVVDCSKKEFLDVDKQHITLFNEDRIKHIIRQDIKDFKNAAKTGIKSAIGTFILLLYNKEQWQGYDEEKNGFLDKFVTKIKGD